MNMLHIETMLIVIIASLSCALPGVFLVLRGISFLTDAISHAVLLGIVIAFLLVYNLSSPFLLAGATLSGFTAVLATETITHHTRLKKDAVIGLVFPVFFSIAVILINVYAQNVHLDADMVMLGDVAFAPFCRLSVGTIDIGPRTLWVLLGALCINSLFIYTFYKELTLATFDYTCAYIAGLYPLLLHYALVILTSFTAVCAFDSVGSIVVIALIVIPAGTACFFAHRITDIIKLSLRFAIVASCIGYAWATYADISISGAIAVAHGCFFFASALGAPKKGLIRTYGYHKQQQQLLYAHLLHDYLVARTAPVTKLTAAQQLNWKLSQLDAIISIAQKSQLITLLGDTLHPITPQRHSNSTHK